MDNHEVYSGGRGGRGGLRRSMMLMTSSTPLQGPPAELTSSDFMHLQLHSTSTFTVHHIQPVWHLLETCSFITFGFAQLPNCTPLPTTGDLFTALGSPVRGTSWVPSFHPLLLHSHPVSPLASLHCTILSGSQTHHYTHNNDLLLSAEGNKVIPHNYTRTSQKETN